MVSAYVVSAFTAHGQGGNKAGVVLYADNLSIGQMQAIAKSLAYSETAFICTSDSATYRVRFFTVTEEVDLCGHATIASWSLLFQKGLVPAGRYTQETLAGILGITISPDGSVFMQQAAVQFYDPVPIMELAPSLGIAEADFERGLQPQVVSTGLRDIMVPVCSKQVLMNLRPNRAKIISLSQKHHVSGLHVFTVATECTAIARNFAPLDGIDEESATGTSNGALLCYLKEYGELPKQGVYRIEQGESMRQISNILGKFIGGRIWIGGQASLQGEVALSV